MSATGSRSNAAGRTMVVRLIRGRPATADTIGMADEIHRAVPRAEIPAHDIPPRADLVRTEAGSWNGAVPNHRTWGLACGIPGAAIRGPGYSTCLLTLH